MAKVFTGKIAIPGDQLDAYLQALEAAEKANAPFRKHLTQLNRAFQRHTMKSVSARTARKHCVVIGAFIDFLCWHTDVTTVGQITRGIANSYFRRWYQGKIGDCSEAELKTAIKKFFQFLDKEKGITNETVLNSFKR